MLRRRLPIHLLIWRTKAASPSSRSRFRRWTRHRRGGFGADLRQERSHSLLSFLSCVISWQPIFTLRRNKPRCSRVRLAAAVLSAGGVLFISEVCMRPAGNFNPEWGYLAPAPSFMRTVRLITVATAIGGAAGAGVVLSVADRPLETSGAARTLVRPVDSAAAASLVTVPPQAAVAQARPQAQRDMQSETRIDATKSAAASGRPADAAASESGA